MSFEIGETWYLDMATGEWSQTTPPDERRPPGRGVITKIAARRGEAVYATELAPTAFPAAL